MNRYLSWIVLSLSLAGCAGGGGTTHNPPARIVAGKSTTLDLEVSAWGSGSGAMTQRYKDVLCHYRVAGQTEYVSLPMQPIGEFKTVSPKLEQGKFRGVLPVFAKRDKAVEYYFDFKFDGKQQSRAAVIVPINSR